MKARCHWPNPLECLHAITPAAVLQRAEQVLNARPTEYA
jgi:hypothetical protein